MTFNTVASTNSAERRRSDLQIVVIDRDHAKAVVSNMLLMLWRYNTTLTAYRGAIRLAKEVAAEHPEGVGVVHIVDAEAVPPAADTRQEFVTFLRLPVVRHFAVAHTSTGFKAAAVRAVVSTQQTLARPTCEHSVHATIPSAAQWAAQHQQRLGHSESAATIGAWLSELRDTHYTKYP